MSDWHKRQQRCFILADEIAAVKKLRREEKAKREAEKLTPQGLKNTERRKLLQNLDKANNLNPELRIKNTQLFLVNLVRFMAEEFNEIVKTKPVQNEKFKELAQKYSVHISVLKQFDAEVEFNASLGYTESLISVLNKFLTKKIPILAKEFNLEQMVNQEKGV